MCGIAGLIGWSSEGMKNPPLPYGHSTTTLPPTDELKAAIVRVDALLTHRGPDGGGLFESPSPHHLVLVHRRLAILDPAGGHQPMGNADGSIQVVFNGEIYNHRELRRQLIDRGHHFTSDHSDTEVLVHGWRQWGTHLPEKLLGMFAFALWDKPTDRLFLARDRMGQKPLFYHHGNGLFAFASTLPALLAWPQVRPEVTRKNLAAYLFHGYPPPPQTIYRNIQQVIPGQWLCASRCGLETGIFFSPADGNLLNETDFPQPASPESLFNTLAAAVESQLEADVPMACFLSGGVDSSIIAALMQQARSAAGAPPINTISIGFANSGFDESPYARQLAQHIGARHHAFSLEPAHGCVETLDWLMQYALGQPFADSSILPTYYVANCARTMAACALSGDGADELFGGYDRYRAIAMLQRWRPAMNLAVRALTTLSRRERLFRLRSAATHSHWLDQYSQLMAVFSPRNVRQHFPALPWNDDAVEWTQPSGHAVSPFRRAMRLDQSHYLPGDVFWKVDSASMACALEVRSPFLDHRVVQAANALNDSDILNWRRGKLALRQAFGHLLPPEVWQRRKHGFAVPIGQWFAGPLAGVWTDVVCRNDSLTRQIAAAEFPRQLLAEHQAFTRDHTHRLFSLFMLELWYRHFRPGIVDG